MWLAVGTWYRIGQHLHVSVAQEMEGICRRFALYFADVYTQIAQLGFEGRRHGRSAGVLPYFHATATLQVEGQYGMPAPGLAASVRQHQSRFSCLLENRHVHANVLPVPVKSRVNVGYPDADLLNARNKHDQFE
jgi:hypothetical protein